ncbi:MAG TPA: MarR family transcriptional regulator, partial [Anaerolineaceae bacterium]|nr:MarR family transcriptional regulator [Anaerolineaceae bacterium]
MRNSVPNRETNGSTGRTTGSVQVVERAIAILKAFTASEPELSVTELSQRLQLPKSTVSRILQTLAQAEFVSRNQETGRYRLDVGILALAENVLGMADLRQIARPYLRALANTIGETASL